MERLGWNDENAVVYCGLCDWSKQSRQHMEHIEADLAAHLRKAHGKRLVYRVEDESNKVTQIPLGETK